MNGVLPFLRYPLLALVILVSLHPWRPASADDASELKVLVGRFFALYQKEDLDGFMALWSEKSPDYASRKLTMQQLFAANDYTFADLALSRVKVEGDKATLRAAIGAITNLIPRTQSTVHSSQSLRWVRNFAFVKEGEAWKVLRYADAVEDLAAALLTAKSDDERKALLTDERELLTPELVRAVLAHGIRSENQGSYSIALSTYRLALSLAEQIGDKASIASTLNNIGIVHDLQGDYARALEFYEKSLAMSEALGDKAGIAAMLNNIGIVHSSQGNYEPALEFHQKSLTLREVLGDKGAIAATLNNIGNVHSSQGNYTSALEFYEKSLTMKEALGDKAGIAATLHNIGIVHSSQGNYALALEFDQKSLTLREALGDKDGIAATLDNIGIVLGLQGNYALALEFYQKSLTMREALGDRAGIASTLHNIGLVHHSQGNYAQALEFYQKSLTMTEALGDKAIIARTLVGIGNFHQSQGTYAQALGYYQKSLKMSEELGDKSGLAATLINIGDVHYSQGNYAQALEFHQKSLTMSEAISDKAGIATALMGIGHVHNSQGNYAQALKYLQKSLAIAEAIDSPDITFHCHWRLGEVHKTQGRKPKAIAAYQKAVATIETIRGQIAGGEHEQQLAFADKVTPYLSLVELLISNNQKSEALSYAERAKARVLLDALQNGKVKVTKAMTKEEQEKERQLNGEFVSVNVQLQREKQRAQPDETRVMDLNARLQKARLDYESFQNHLYAAHPELKVKRGETKPITLDQVRTLLPNDDTALLEFIVTDDRTYLFLLAKDSRKARAKGEDKEVGLKVYPITIKREELAKHITTLRDQITERKEFSPKSEARKLYELLLNPVQSELEGKSHLIIVPDGVLWELPFQILQPRDNHYLIEDAAISYAPSLTALYEMQRLRPPLSKSPTLLALGNPTLDAETEKRVQFMSRGELQPLPHAEKEVKALGKLYGSRGHVYIGADATEERVKAESSQYHVLHFATHGIVNPASPMYSQIVLTQSPHSLSSNNHQSYEDGLLEAWEMMQMDLHADLAVLSACETGRGRLSAGEGMIGLTWALFVAGCPSTVASQWMVADNSTSTLMIEFHRQLRKGLSKVQALRMAQLRLLKTGRRGTRTRGVQLASPPPQRSKLAHPYYWAPFVLIGDWR